MSTEIIAQMTAGLSDLIKVTQDYKTVLGDASAEAKQNYKSALAETTTAMQGQLGAVNLLSKAYRDSYLPGLKDSIRDVERQSAISARNTANMKLATFAASGYASQLNQLAKAADWAGKKVGKMTDFLSSEKTAFGNVRGELESYNRAMFESSRQAQILGRAGDMTEASWKKTSKAISMSRTEFLKMNVEINKLYTGLGPTQKELAGLTDLIEKRFGRTAEIVGDVTRRFASLNSTVPGIMRELNRYQETGIGMDPKELEVVNRLLEKQGVAMRDKLMVNQAFSKTTPDQSKLLDYETAVQLRNKEIMNANLKMGKNSETALIAIEEGMAKIVNVAGKLADKFNLIPTAMISMKAIGMSSILSMTGAVRGLTDQFRGLSSEVGRSNAAMGDTGKRAAGVRAGGRGMGMIGGAAVLGSVAYAGYGAYKDYKGTEAKAGAGLADRSKAAIANAEGRMSGTGKIIGGVIGGVAGGFAGGPLGAAAGVQLGSMAGGSIATSFGGMSDEEKEKLGVGAKALETVKAREGYKGGIDIGNDAVIKSEADILRIVNQQNTAKKRASAISALANSGYIKRNEIQKKFGANDEKILKTDEKRKATAFSIGQAYAEQNAQLQNIFQSSSKVVQAHESMLATSQKSNAGFAMAAGIMERQADALERQRGTAIEIAKLFSDMYGGETKKVASSFKSAGFEEKMVSEGVAEDDAKELNILLSKSLVLRKKLTDLRAVQGGGNREEIDVARKKAEAADRELKVRSSTLGVTDKIYGVEKKTGEVMIEKFYEMASANMEADKRTILAQKHDLIQSSTNKTLKSSMAYHEGASKYLGQQRGLATSQAELAEATAAGYAVSYAHRKKIYDLTGQQVSMEKSAMKNLDATINREVKKVAGNKETAKLLKDQGVSQNLISQAVNGNASAVMKFNEKIKDVAASTKDDKLLRTYYLIAESINLRIEKEKQVTDLMKEQVGQAMALKEGYLDVINEMTTGSDLISKLLPDAQRGVVSMHEMAMTARGESTGGALRRGLVSVNPFQDSMDVSKAGRYTASGFQAPKVEGIVQSHLRSLEKSQATQNKAGGPGTFGGQRGPGQSVIGEGGKPLPGGTGPVTVNNGTIINNYQGGNPANAKTKTGASNPGGKMFSTGGLIPGSPSDSDNLMGTIDGKAPIGLASGEYIVNARATKKNLSLLRAINGPESPADSGGYSSGGLANFLSTKYHKWAFNKGYNSESVGKLKAYIEKSGGIGGAAINAGYGSLESFVEQMEGDFKAGKRLDGSTNFTGVLPYMLGAGSTALEFAKSMSTSYTPQLFRHQTSSKAEKKAEVALGRKPGAIDTVSELWGSMGKKEGLRSIFTKHAGSGFDARKPNLSSLAKNPRFMAWANSQYGKMSEDRWKASTYRDSASAVSGMGKDIGNIQSAMLSRNSSLSDDEAYIKAYDRVNGRAERMIKDPKYKRWSSDYQYDLLIDPKKRERLDNYKRRYGISDDDTAIRNMTMAKAARDNLVGKQKIKNQALSVMSAMRPALLNVRNGLKVDPADAEILKKHGVNVPPSMSNEDADKLLTSKMAAEKVRSVKGAYPKRKKDAFEKFMSTSMYDKALNIVDKQHSEDVAWKNAPKHGLFAGGLVGSGASGSTPSSLSMSGGMKIGTLYLNGRVIGNDVGGGVGDEWKTAAKNAYG